MTRDDVLESIEELLSSVHNDAPDGVRVIHLGLISGKWYVQVDSDSLFLWAMFLDLDESDMTFTGPTTSGNYSGHFELTCSGVQVEAAVTDVEIQWWRDERGA